jgi:hypothetical protein
LIEAQGVEFRFEPGQADTEELQLEISQILAELSDGNSEAAHKAVSAGLDPLELAGVRTTVEEEGKGFAGADIVVQIVVQVGAGVAVHIVEKFWDDVIWPRIKGQLGGDALGPRR